MKRWLGVMMALNVLLGLGTGLGRAADTGDSQQINHFNQQMQKINKQAKDPKVLQLTMEQIATETGVPVDQVRSQHRTYPDEGAASLLVANVLAAETKKSPNSFLKERSSGKRWVDIAQENKVPMEKFIVRLDRIEKAIAPAAQTGK